MAKNKTATVPSKKTVCPLTLEQFQEAAKGLKVTVAGKDMIATVKAPFSSGSFGWFAGGKIVLEVDGVPVNVQVGLNMTVIGSKPVASE